jgi:hypothetical protein
MSIEVEWRATALLLLGGLGGLDSDCAVETIILLVKVEMKMMILPASLFYATRLCHQIECMRDAQVSLIFAYLHIYMCKLSY